MYDLQGKTVLVTGAAVRIGRSLALATARAGARVVIHYGSSAAEAEAAAAEIHAQGGQAYLLSADLSQADEAQELVNRARTLAGPLDALINNAAIFEPLDWDQTGIEAWNRHLAINLTAPFLLSQAFARALAPDAQGRIVNLLDWRALRPGADHLPYTISKAALAALTHSLAAALAPRICVNALALGAILPPSDRGASGSERTAADRIIAPVPARRWGTLDEVQQALLFLLTGPAYITGEILHVDGGRHLV